MSRLKKELNKTSQQKLKKFTKTLGNYEYITNANEFVEKFKEVIMWDIRSLKGCSERAITDYYIETITDMLNKHTEIDDKFFDNLKSAARTRIAAFYTNKTFDNNIDIYFNDVKREYILHPQNESENLAFVPENRDIFIKNNLKLVINCAKRYQNYGLTFEDLIQIGNQGLLIAWDKFDEERGNLRITINKLIDDSELESFTYDDAVDIIKKVPVGFSLASRSNYSKEIITKAMENDYVKLRHTRDIIGTEICGSIKNVIAIAAGMLDGMGYPISTSAMFITESLHDIKALIKTLGGDKNTILSFAGFGDILLTCTSVKSRNYTLGRLIGEGKSKEEVDKYIESTTIEGLYTLYSIKKLLRNKKIKMPIINLIYDIIVNEKEPSNLAKFLVEKE